MVLIFPSGKMGRIWFHDPEGYGIWLFIAGRCHLNTYIKDALPPSNNGLFPLSSL